MSSYYGDRSRDIPSWDAFEAADDDEVVDQSEVQPPSNAFLAKTDTYHSTNTLHAIIYSYVSTPRLRCRLHIPTGPRPKALSGEKVRFIKSSAQLPRLKGGRSLPDRPTVSVSSCGTST